MHNTLHIHVYSRYHSGIDVSLTQENYAAVEETEDTSVMVCAMIVSGSIQRQVSVTLDTVDMGTASCKTLFNN